jgi:hypothetical protein
MVDAPILSPYVVATAPLWRRVDRAPLGTRLLEEHWFDPTRVASRPFIDCLDRLDELTFGPLGMRMPRWALYDCAALPGAIIGLGAPATQVSGALRSALAPPDDASFLPLTMCLLTPRAAPDEWLAYSISSLLELDDQIDGRQAESESLALALAAVGARRVLSTTQWESQRLDVHARFAPLDVLAAHVPAHTHKTSFVYRFEAAPARLAAAVAGAPAVPAGARVVDPSDAAGLDQLARRIEGGTCVRLVGTTRVNGTLRGLISEEPA